METSDDIDFKFVEAYLNNKFLKPFVRRLKYIYFGLDHPENIFVLSDTEDIKFKYCEVMQTTGMVKIHNCEDLNKIFRWLDFYKIDRSIPSIFYFNQLVSILNKITWNNPSIKIEKNQQNIVTLSLPEGESIIIAQPIDTYFTLTKLQGFVNKYTQIFFEDNNNCYDIIPMETKKTTIITTSVSCTELQNAGLLDKSCEDINLVLLPGLDLLVSKSLITKNKEYKYNIRLWSDNGKQCINYGSFYTDADISVCTSRDNVFIFPIAKKEVICDTRKSSE